VTETSDAQNVRGGELSLASRVTYHVLHAMARLLVLVYFRAYVRNAKNLPKTGKVIISPVHRSNLDVPLLGATCPRRLRYLSKGSLFKNRFWGWFLTVIGGFPLARESIADRGALSAATMVLERGEALVMFPEGERKSGPTVHPIADGAVWLAARTGAPILPVGIGGSEQALPKSRLFPRPRRLVFLYGDLIYPPTPEPGRRRVSRSALREFSDSLRTNVQALFDEAQELAGAPNPPVDQRPPLP
jgi:1-acyl-sn-glycerol-3-phosphate acyltransferase